MIRLKAKGEYKKALSEQMINVALKDYAQKNGISVSDSELQEYADKKRKELGLFSVTATEKYFSNLGINIDQWSDGLEEELLKEKVKKTVATEEKVKEYFEANRLRFICVPLHRIVVKEKSMAEGIRMQIEDEDEDFSALAKKYSIDSSTAPTGGYMGVIRRGALPVEVEAKVFSAAENELCGVFEDADGYSLYKPGKVVYPELDEAMKENIIKGLFDLWTNNLLNSATIKFPN
jgi:parvulin-like peptidyl-prolyl isomerase